MDGRAEMKYWFSDMGDVEEGKLIEVAINRAANVRVVDKENFEKYKKLEQHEYIGGHVKFSPYKVKLPRTDHWFVVVDLGGKPGKVNASFTVLPKDRKSEVIRFED